MTTYSIVDVANLFHRARHVVRGDAYTKAGMALAIVFKSLRKLHREMKSDHMVLCAEGHSWRYTVYPQYKAKRKLDRMVATASPADQEEEEVFHSVMNDFINYMAEKTKCTVLQSPGIEGDDFIARWVQLHPDDEHIILSGDSDFFQLIAPNVSIYNGVDDRLLTVNGVFNGQGAPLYFTLDGGSGKLKVSGTIEEMKKRHDGAQKGAAKLHIKNEKERAQLFEAAEKIKLADNPSYKARPFVANEYLWEEFKFEMEPNWWRKALFIKIVRGDTSDGIFSAYPGARYHGSKNKVGICEAWEDRDTQGYNWNNFMLQKWHKLIGTDKDGNSITKEVRVLDEYKFNESLIDLTKQPDDVIQLMDTVIIQATQKEPIGNIGIHFMRFCAKHDLPSLAKDATDHAAYLAKGYS